MTAGSELPSFKNPPVTETVLGVQFEPIDGLSNAHLGAFWECWRDYKSRATQPEEWPHASHAPLLPLTYEKFDTEFAWSPNRLRLQLTEDPACRIQLRSATGDSMIQAQNGRFHYNWLLREGAEYPRYQAVYDRFIEAFDQFRKFLARAGFHALRPTQWEVTYVNQIPRGTVWNSIAECQAVFPGLFGLPQRRATVVDLEDLSCNWRFVIPDRRGRLYVSLTHGITSDDQTKEVLMASFTARGQLRNLDELDHCFGIGRTAIVMTFKEVTSAHAHACWGLEE